ncbi:MAG: hypothetical protein WAQ22_01840 [Candidatus Saccharimonas sp.]
MFAFMQLVVIHKITVIKRIFQNLFYAVIFYLVAAALDRALALVIATVRLNAVVIQILRYFAHCLVALRVQLESLGNFRRNAPIKHNPLGVFVIYIANRRNAWHFTASNFCSQTTLDVFREIIDKMLALAKLQRQHILALRCILKPKSRKLEIDKYALVEQV